MIIKVDDLKVNISNARTLSHEQKKIILSEIVEGALEIYKPLSKRCKITGLEMMIYGMLDAALDVYVFFHEKRDEPMSTWKYHCVNSSLLEIEIYDWIKQIVGQARFLIINYSESESRNLLMVIKQVFSQINGICASNSDHNFKINVHRQLFDKCIEELEVEFNTESLKLRNELNKNINHRDYGYTDNFNRKYNYSVYFNGEEPKSEYDLMLIKSTPRPEVEIGGIDKLNIFLCEKLIYLLYKNGKPLFNIEECLEYHCEHSSLNRSDFKQFTEMILLEKLEFIKNTPINKRITSRINNWIAVDNPTKIVNELSLPKPKEVASKLEDVALDNKALTEIYGILANEGLIDKESKIVIDNCNGHKGHFLSSLMLFHQKGYFKRKPNNEEYVNICLNSFGLKISIQLAKNNKPRANSSLIIPPFDLNS